MPRALLFLGAGASKSFGVPTMFDMVTTMSTFLKRTTPPGMALYNKVLKEVKRSNKGRLDLEKVLDVVNDLANGQQTLDSLRQLAPHAAYRVQRLVDESGQTVSTALSRFDREIRNSKKEAAHLEALCVEYIRNVCTDAQRPQAADAYRVLLEKLGSADLRNAENVGIGEGKMALQGGSTIQLVEVATTNYDGCFEAFASKYNVTFENGFEYAGHEHEHHFNYQRLFTGRNWPLLKLHGSVDWWRAEDNRVVEFPGGRPGAPLRSGVRLKEPEIRYPVSLKDIFGDPYLHIYNRFAQSLMDCDVWIFIGYAFGDPSVLRLLLGSIRKQTKIVVVSPHAPELVKATFSDALPGVRIPVKGEFPQPECMEALAEAAHRT